MALLCKAPWGNAQKARQRSRYLRSGRSTATLAAAATTAAVPWAQLESIIEPFYPKAGNGRKPYPLSTMLRIHCLQQWYCLSNPTMEEELHEIVSMRQFAGLSLSRGSIVDETTILNFRHLLERHNLARQILEQVTDYLQEKGLMRRHGTIMDCDDYFGP